MLDKGYDHSWPNVFSFFSFFFLRLLHIPATPCEINNLGSRSLLKPWGYMTVFHVFDILSLWICYKIFDISIGADLFSGNIKQIWQLMVNISLYINIHVIILSQHFGKGMHFMILVVKPMANKVLISHLRSCYIISNYRS